MAKLGHKLLQVLRMQIYLFHYLLKLKDTERQCWCRWSWVNLKPACMSECMACNGVLTPQQKQPPKSVVTPPPSPKIFNYPPPPPPTPQPSNFLLPPSNWKWLLLHFSHMATSNKQILIFLELLYNWLNAVIIDF